MEKPAGDCLKISARARRRFEGIEVMGDFFDFKESVNEPAAVGPLQNRRSQPLFP
jgi:hypothetical protein